MEHLKLKTGIAFEPWGMDCAVLEKYKDNVYLDFENDFKMVQEIALPNYIYYQKGVSH